MASNRSGDVLLVMGRLSTGEAWGTEIVGMNAILLLIDEPFSNRLADCLG